LSTISHWNREQIEEYQNSLWSNSVTLTYGISVQLLGFRWLHDVDLNQVGFVFRDLVPENPKLTVSTNMETKSTSIVDGIPTINYLPEVNAALRCLISISKVSVCIQNTVFTPYNIVSLIHIIAIDSFWTMRKIAKSV